MPNICDETSRLVRRRNLRLTGRSGFEPEASVAGCATTFDAAVVAGTAGVDSYGAGGAKLPSKLRGECEDSWGRTAECDGLTESVARAA